MPTIVISNRVRRVGNSARICLSGGRRAPICKNYSGRGTPSLGQPWVFLRRMALDNRKQTRSRNVYWPHQDRGGSFPPTKAKGCPRKPSLPYRYGLAVRKTQVTFPSHPKALRISTGWSSSIAQPTRAVARRSRHKLPPAHSRAPKRVGVPLFNPTAGNSADPGFPRLFLLLCRAP